MLFGLNLSDTIYSRVSLRSMGTGISARFLKSMFEKKSCFFNSAIEL